MEIREYRPEDLKEITELFYQTVHTVNSRDYTQEQVNAWADGNPDLNAWSTSLAEHYTLVAVRDGRIVGFGDMDETGYLDRLYVHADCQGQGIASQLCGKLEKHGSGSIRTHASITAKPFFEKRGYLVKKEQRVAKNGVEMTNYVMERQL